MRRAGRISAWNEDKGYGFVVPHDGGNRAFVHIKAFQFGSRRPVDDDLISYSTSKDDRGRTTAVDVRFAGQRIESRGPTKPVPRLALGAIALVTVVLGTLSGIVPSVIPIGYLAFSSLSYFMYSVDKMAAGRGMQRTPESTLHVVDFLGGWPGGLIAQQRLRHKTVKTSFQSTFWVTVLANIAGVTWLVHSGVAHSLTDAVLGG